MATSLFAEAFENVHPKRLISENGSSSKAVSRHQQYPHGGRANYWSGTNNSVSRFF
jgi:hypothetical protein